VGAGFDVGGRHLGGLYEGRQKDDTATENTEISSDPYHLVNPEGPILQKA
jgi:hypothetical protein